MKSSPKTAFKLSDLIHGLDVTIQGNPDCLITGIAPIQEACAGHITFLSNALYRKHLARTAASAVILSPQDVDLCSSNVIISANPYYTYAKIAEFFNVSANAQQGVHLSAQIPESCQLDSSVSVAAHAVLGEQVRLGANVRIGPGCYIGDHVEIGDNTEIDANVTIYHHVKIGQRTRIASGVVLGSDGFGFANQKGVWHKVPQLGSVEIGDDVDVGANTTIDRGAVGNTIIANGVKLDNLIQVGHNVQIGEHTIIAGCVAIAGSTVIGKNCMVGGGSLFAGHIEICDNAMITGMTAVTKSIREAGIYSSGIVGAVPNHEFRKNNARFHRLESLMDRVKKLELVLKDKTERNAQ